MAAVHRESMAARTHRWRADHQLISSARWVGRTHTVQLNEWIANSSAPRLEAELGLTKRMLDEEREARAAAEQQAAVALAKLEKTETQAVDLATRLAKAEAWMDEARGTSAVKR